MQLNGTLWIFLQLASAMSIGMAYSGEAEHREVHIGLNKDGSMAENCRLPACGNGKIINILSHNYLQRNCGATCLSLSVGKLSAEAEMRLHEMCSFKESCSKMSFPVSDLRNQSFNIVSVRYTCAEWGRTVFNMCDNPSYVFKKPIELVAKNAKGLKNCTCFLFTGKFKIRINPFRLRGRETGNCSRETLIINTQRFTCNETEPNQGSVFNGTETVIMHNAMIALEYYTTTPNPQIVALTLLPLGSSDGTILKCSSQKVIEVTTIPPLKSESPGLHHRHNSSRYIATETLSEKREWVVPLGVTPCVIVVLLIAAVLVWKRHPLLKRWRRKNTHNGPDKDADDPNKSHLNQSFSGDEETEKSLGETALAKKEENIYTRIKETFTSEVSTAGDNDNTYDKTSMGNRVQRNNLNYNRLPNSVRSDFVTEALVPKPGSDIYSLAEPSVA